MKYKIKIQKYTTRKSCLWSLCSLIRLLYGLLIILFLKTQDKNEKIEIHQIKRGNNDKLKFRSASSCYFKQFTKEAVTPESRSFNIEWNDILIKFNLIDDDKSLYDIAVLKSELKFVTSFSDINFDCKIANL